MSQQAPTPLIEALICLPFSNAGVGYQYSLLKTKNHKVSAGGGVGYLDVEYTDGTPGISGVAGRLSLDYVGKLTENFTVVLENEVEHFADAPRTAIDNTDSTTGLKFIYKF